MGIVRKTFYVLYAVSRSLSCAKFWGSYINCIGSVANCLYSRVGIAGRRKKLDASRCVACHFLFT